MYPILDLKDYSGRPQTENGLQSHETRQAHRGKGKGRESPTGCDLFPPFAVVVRQWAHTGKRLPRNGTAACNCVKSPRPDDSWCFVFLWTTETAFV